MKTIVFYGLNGQAALDRCAAIRAESSDNKAQAIQADAYSGERLIADNFEFMPDVNSFWKDRIEKGLEKAGKRIVIYCGPDREGANQVAAKLTAEGHSVSVRTASTFQGTPELCNGVLIMPDVPEAQQRELVEHYGERKAMVAPDDFRERTDERQERPANTGRVPIADPAPQAAADDGAGGPTVGGEDSEEDEKPPAFVKKADGKFVVMRDGEQIAGPFDKKADAKAFADTANKPA